MSIVRQLIQLAVVEAWRGRTLAGGDVFESRIDTLDQLVKGQVRPLLIFSIEEAEQDDDGQAAAGFLGRDVRFTGMVQATVASGQEIKGPDGVTVIRPAIGESDSAYEATLNILDFQWRWALQDYENPWAVVFRGLVVKIGKIKDTRATDPETGLKHAVRFTQFHAEAIPDPAPGDDLPGVIEDGLTLLESDGDEGYARLAGEWRALLAEGGDWPEWRNLQSALFASRGKLAALGHGPLSIDDEVEFIEAQINVSGVGPVVVSDDDP